MAWRHSPLIALALLFAVGLVALGDYGVYVDEWVQRGMGAVAADYILADGDPLADDDFHRFYGVAFETALVLAERALGLDDHRSIVLTRHLLTHAFFLAAGLATAALAFRMFSSRWLALFSMLTFALHPRIYAHSFINSKDAPFLSAFAISLYLIHWSFGRNRIWSFALCGAWVGLTTNIRVLGAILFLAVAGLLALDFARAIRAESGDAKRALGNLAAFSLSAALALYATWHILWDDPLAFLDGLRVLSNHPNPVIQLFRGELIPNYDLPPYFAPFWIAITTPPITLALAAVGIGAAAWAALRDPSAALGNSETRFRLLLVACLALPLAGLAIVRPNASDGWRQLYFLYAPMCLLAVCGLHALVRAAASPLAARWFRRVIADPKNTLPPVACALAAFGLATAALEMAAIHPHQTTYFNIFVDKTAPNLRARYDMEYSGASVSEGLAWLAESRPDTPLRVRSQITWAHYAKSILPPEDYARITVEDDMPDFYITNHREHALSGNLETDLFAPAIYERRVYGNVIMSVLAVNLDMADAETAEPYRRLWDAAASGALGEPVIRADWDVYMDGGALIYLREPCVSEDARGFFTLAAAPVDPADSPKTNAPPGGADSLTFYFAHYGVRLGDKCLIRRPLPDYPIRAITAGQYVSGEGAVWQALAVLPMNEAAMSVYRNAHQAARNGEYGEPITQSEFDVYLDGDTLIYLKQPCAEEDARGRFLLSAFPENADDIPMARRELGFDHESLNFDFAMRGARFDGVCMAWRGLPGYPLRAIETGQWIPGGAELWRERAELIAPDGG